jgi:hypothetical protein
MRSPRFRLRTLMAAVAVAGVGLGLWTGLHRRARRFQGLAEYHRMRSTAGVSPLNPRGPTVVNFLWEETPRARASWHSAMADKYTYAARSPWLPVAPDPPPPE